MQDHKQELCSYLDSVWDDARRERRQLSDRLRSSKYLCLFGAGQVGQAVSFDLAAADIPVSFFCDNNPVLWGKTVNRDIVCISVKELERHKNDVLILVTTGYFRAVCAQLSAAGFENVLAVPQLYFRNNAYWDTVECAFVKEQVRLLIDLLDDDQSRRVVAVTARNWFGRSDAHYGFGAIAEPDQYFPQGIIMLSDRETFVDVGAFDGDTLVSFLSRVNGRFEHVFAYELEPNCFRKLTVAIKTMDKPVQDRITAYNMGLYDINTSVGYIPNTTSSSINAAAGAQGKVVTLTDHLKGRDVTFIKMDIEGAEPKALKGAEGTIRSCSPKLAICVYHEPPHLWEIPFFIKKCVPGYRLFLRHHSQQEYETVCYAVG